MRIAFAGFRHKHVTNVLSCAKSSGRAFVVAACEEDEEQRQAIAREGVVSITHSSISRMLDEVDSDAVVVGDYYSRRGAIVADALRRGRHVLADKPMCTSLEELDAIRRLVGESGLQIGMMLDLRDAGQFIKAREIVRSGSIGEVHAVYVGGQHAIRLDSRPHWYFEPGKHGGTINDIGVHGFDIIEWITGLRFTQILAARAWNARLPQYPHFQDCAQFMMKMENGCGVIGDVSYLAPDNTAGSAFTPGWRVTLWGSEGVLETSHAAPVTVWRNGAPVEVIESLKPNPCGYFRSFLASVEGGAEGCGLTTRDCLRASEIALKTQLAADEGLCNLAI